MALFEQINNDIKESMRNRNQVRLDTLRMLKSKILTVDARGALSDEEVVKLFKTYAGNLEEALKQAIALHRKEAADKLQMELTIVHEFLPKALSLEETKQLVIQAIEESGAKTKKELGLVMKTIIKLNGQVDGKMAKDLADSLLLAP